MKQILLAVALVLNCGLATAAPTLTQQEIEDPKIENKQLLMSKVESANQSPGEAWMTSNSDAVGNCLNTKGVGSLRFSSGSLQVKLELNPIKGTATASIEPTQNKINSVLKCIEKVGVELLRSSSLKLRAKSSILYNVYVIAPKPGNY